jgi:hypothetical protein
MGKYRGRIYEISSREREPDEDRVCRIGLRRRHCHFMLFSVIWRALQSIADVEGRWKFGDLDGLPISQAALSYCMTAARIIGRN